MVSAVLLTQSHLGSEYERRLSRMLIVERAASSCALFGMSPSTAEREKLPRAAPTLNQKTWPKDRHLV